MVGFIFGGNTGRSYEELQRQRETADAIAAQIMGRQLPTTALGGIGALIGGIGAGVTRYNADKELKAGTDKSNSGFGAYLKNKILGNPTDGSPYGPQPRFTSGGIPMPGAAAEVKATSPVVGDTYAPFMDTIKAGGVDNPYALAAIAATGRAESGWSGKKAVSTWNDPSESGQAGTSGGIMSWRGPRYQALAATGDLSPEGQAKFFLNEDPKLIESLKGAKSVEEAQMMMNNAWAFAGYNRPGGESSRRLGYAKGYLSNFQGGNNAGTEVASLDPSIGMTAAGAIETAAPRAAYRDPMVSAPNAMQTAQAQPQAPAQPGNMAMLPQNGPMPQQRPQEVAQNGGGYFPAAPQPPSAPNAPQPRQAPASNGAEIAQLMQWANDPFLSPQMKAQAQMLLQQELQKQQNAQQDQTWRARQDYEHQQQQGDPLYQLKLEAARKELETGKRQPLVNAGDGQIYDPNKGEWIAQPQRAGAGNGQFRFEGKSVEAQSLNGLMDSNALTPAQAQQLGAGKTVTDPASGAILFMTPEGVFGRTPDGAVSPLGGGQQQPSSGSVDIFAGMPAEQAAVPQQAAPTAPPMPQQAPQAPQASQMPQATQGQQRPGMIPITSPKGDKPTEQQRNRTANVNQAFDAITGELDRYSDLVNSTGIEAMPGVGKDNLNTVRQGVMLQMKELFNLGVLNGPDLSLMERMIYDPVVDPMKEGGMSNLPSQMWDAATGQSGERAANSVNELKRMLGNIKESVGRNANPLSNQNSGQPAPAAPVAPSAPANGGISPGMIDNGYRFKGGNPALESNWERVN